MSDYPNPCDEHRRQELRQLLMLIAKRTTKDGTLTALARTLDIQKHNLSRWIRAGEVPPYKARDLLKLDGVNPKGTKQRITLELLTPSLF